MARWLTAAYSIRLMKTMKKQNPRKMSMLFRYDSFGIDALAFDMKVVIVKNVVTPENQMVGCVRLSVESLCSSCIYAFMTSFKSKYKHIEHSIM